MLVLKAFKMKMKEITDINDEELILLSNEFPYYARDSGIPTSLTH